MIVVADTSPLNYLLQINSESVLPALYKRIIVPWEVLAELSHPDTPAAVSVWLLHLPE
jgi:predicted nucleic acid-binding protein